mgnify:CR=1 FL=1|jgi:TRAP-type C4-dicarboxylate transport system permease small subunit
MDRLTTYISRLFGWSLLALSAFVGLETLLRKLVNTSLQGADELGGYVLAVGSSLAFIVALIERAHIRIDILHRRFPTRVQALLDCVAAVSLAGLGGFFLYVGWFVIEDTLSYGSTAATPWATPLIWPQGAWYAALAIFAIAAIGLGLYAVRLAAAGRWRTIAETFNPRGAEEEVAEELADQARR